MEKEEKNFVLSILVSILHATKYPLTQLLGIEKIHYFKSQNEQWKSIIYIKKQFDFTQDNSF